MIDIRLPPQLDWNTPDKVLVKENFITDEMCDELIEYGKQHVIPGIAKYSTSRKLSYSDCRLPQDHVIKDVFANHWEEIVNFHGFDVNFIEPFIVKEYKTGDFFDPHPDNFAASIGQTQDRKFTLIVQLSDEQDYTGGDLVIYNSRAFRKKGTLISFPSFYIHTVPKILSGTRWSLINWAWGPYWR